LAVALDDEDLHVRFGPGLIRRRFPLAGIRSWEQVRNPWWWGYGIRYYSGGTLYNASGTAAIEVTLNDGRRIRVGMGGFLRAPAGARLIRRRPAGCSRP
jgi:hypothetical protein